MYEFDPQRYPTTPGCYLMKDAAGQIIYVGKAKDLRRRLASYFQPRRKDWKTERMVARIRDIEVILVNNEVESLVLENNLIKRHKPRFNRMLVPDNTGYSYIVLTQEPFPRLVPYRKNRINAELERGGGAAIEQRFGPYVSRRFRDVLLEFVNESFQLRTCATLPRRACLYYHMHQCSGPCEFVEAAQRYGQAVAQAVAFLSSRDHLGLIREMRQQMQQHAARLEFERAQRVRDQVEAMERVLQHQIVERDARHDQDVVYFGEGAAMVASLKRGALIDMSMQPVMRGEVEFLLARCERACPAEVVINRPPNRREVEAELKAGIGRAVKVTLPSRGVGRELLELCRINYEYRCGLGHSVL